jgi:hypothetical protein
MNPEQPGIKPEKPGITQNQSGKFPDQLGNSGQLGQANTPPQNDQPSPEQDPDAPPKIQSNDEEFVAAALELRYQRKGRSPFDKLSPQDQAVVKAIAQPYPIGFALKVSKTALYNFHKRYQKRRHQQNVEASIDLLNKSSNPTQAFAQTFERLVQTKALTVASDPETTLNTFDALITSVNKLRKQSLAERKQLQAESKPKPQT